MTKPNRSMTLNLHGNNVAGVIRKLGALSIQAEETIASKTVVEMNLRSVNLDNKDLFSKSVSANLNILPCLFPSMAILNLFYSLFLGSVFKNFKVS